MHKTQYDEKRLALTEAGNVDDIYDLLAAHEHKVSTADQVRDAADLCRRPSSCQWRMYAEQLPCVLTCPICDVPALSGSASMHVCAIFPTQRMQIKNLGTWKHYYAAAERSSFSA